MKLKSTHSKTWQIALNLLVVLLSLIAGAKANPVDMKLAREVGAKFINANTAMKVASDYDLHWVTTYRTDNKDAAFYVFNTQKGFVIVSADDCATPILGYSEEGLFDTEDMPPQMEDYLQGFVEQIQYGVDHHLTADAIIARQWELVKSTGLITSQKGTKSVQPLLTDTWNQNCYYNNLCPEDSNGPCGHVYAGCTGTSMGQIMHYWKYPMSGTGSVTYTPSGYPEQSVDFAATVYDWDNMPDNLTASSSSTQINAVATLLWHCGVALNANYGPNGTGAYPSWVPDILTGYFNYSSDLYGAYRSDYSDDTWLSMVKSSLDLGRPLHYSGWNSDGGGGHSFVCDGYDDNDYLHFNWGWSGSYNNYFAVNALYAGSYDFSYNNFAVFNIHPNCVSGATYQVWATASPSDGGSVSGDGAYDCGEICTLTATANAGYMFLYWMDAAGQTVSTQTEYSFVVMEDKSFSAYFVEEGSVCGITINLNDSYGDGWNGNKLAFSCDNGYYEEITLESGSSGTQTLWVENGSHVTLAWITGQWTNECSYSICYSNGNVIYYGSNMSSSFSYEFDVDCEEMPEVTFVITAEANPTEGGMVNGAGSYSMGSVCALEAAPNEDYFFLYWTENGNQVSSNAQYSFVVTSDHNLVAHFMKNCVVDPENVQVNVISYTEATVNWTSDNDHFELRYKKNDPEGFENGIPDGWAIIDADGDGYSWGIDDPVNGYHFNGYNSNQCASSASYINNVGVLNPDNYLVTPQIELGGDFGFWACAQDMSYASEHFGVAVSTGSQTDVNDFVMLQEWQMTAKGAGAKSEIRGGNRAQGNWYYYSVDLSAYAGQTGYVAIRHFNCSDMYYLVVDDVNYVNSEWTTVTGITGTSYTLTGLDVMSNYTVEVRSSCGDGTNYSNWVGVGFTNNYYTVTANADPSEGGTVTGVGEYFSGTTCTLAAEANEGYSFMYWTEDGVVVSSEVVYSFTVTTDRVMVAHFTLPFTVTAGADPVEGGTVNGTGSYDYGSICTLTAIPNEGYYFLYWTENGNQVSSNADYSLVVTSDRNLVAHFMKNCTVDPENVQINVISYTEAEVNWTSDNDLFELRYRKGDMEGFENGIPENWATIDADGDGYTWGIGDPVNGYHFNGYNSNQCASSASYINNVGVLYPDNYLVTPQINLGGVLCFWACAEDKNYASEHFGVAVSTGSQTDVNDFVMLQEWQMTAKGTGAKSEIRGGNRTQGRWYYYSVDLSAYAGQTGYIAIRHFNCNDIYYLDVDDICYSNAEWTTVTGITGTSYTLTDLDGMSDYMVEVRSSCGDGTNYSNWVGVGFANKYYTVTADANPSEGGTVTGGGEFSNGTTCTLIAINHYGYNFASWTDTLGQVVSYQPVYSFTVTEDATYHANFVGMDVYFESVAMITNYDLQSNSALGNRIATWADGSASIVATWDHSGNTAYPDRGTGYNYFDSLSFGEMPVERIESIRSGWPTIAPCGDGEVLASHASGVNVYYRPVKGQGEWSQIANFSYPDLSWPRIATSGPDGQYIHVVASDEESVDGTIVRHMYYVRSTDRGQTWSDVMEMPLVNNDADGEYRNQLSADKYVMATNGDNVAILFGAYNTEVFYVISHDNGATWEKQVVAPLPVEGLHAIWLEEDYPDGGDEIFYTCDGSYSIAIDDNGTVHVAFALFAWQPAGGSTYTLWKDLNHGVVYWNSEYVNEEGGHEILGSLELENLDFLADADGHKHLHVTGNSVDEDGDGYWNASDNDRPWTNRTKGLSTTPGISVDEQGNVAIIFSTLSEMRTNEYGYHNRSAFVTLKDFVGNWYDNAVNLSEGPVHVDDDVYPTFAAAKGYNGTFWLGYSADDHQGLNMDGSNDGLLTENRIYAVNLDATSLPGWGHATQTQTITLTPGWNWFSTYLSGEPTELLQMLENSLGSNGIVIKSNAVSTDYYDDYGWYGDLDDEGLKSSQMYMIKTNAACTVELEGVPANPAEVGITIRHGWNWIGFPCAEAMSVADALAGFQAEDGDILKSSGASTDYYEGFGWYGELETMEPGEGFMYYSNSQTTKTVYFP